MQRKHVLAYLLFSFFLFFPLCSCFLSSNGELAKLVEQGRYEELERKTATMHTRSIDAFSLFYRSVALQQLDRGEDAFHVLNLYFGMANEDDEHLAEAHHLMCSLSYDPYKVVSSARWLEERALLEQEDAQGYYQALFMVGEKLEAERVFEEHLKDTIKPFAYAQMILGSSTDIQKLEQALSSLSLQQKLTLLQSVASGTVSQERAILLLSFATPLEQAFEGKAALVQVYHLLETLYGYADVRVQQRKYSTLAQNFR